jgi:thiamine-phosphate pyrophosphorylase
MISTGWKKRLLQKCRLYIILDKETLGAREPFKVAQEAAKTGNCILQLRDKSTDTTGILQDAIRVGKVLSKTKSIFIINDYIDIAKMVNCDGIHVGQEDLSIGLARKILGKDKIIGISCHSVTQALRAQNNGADYIGIGPVFSTPTKPDYNAIGCALLKEIKKNITIPFFAIGGIDEVVLPQVVAAGAERVAVCRAVCRAKNITHSIRNLKNYLY